MPTWYNATVKHQIIDEKGFAQIITEKHLFDAVSYTDAEARVYAELATEREEFKVHSLTKAKFNHIYCDETTGDAAWYKAKVNYIIYDEKAQKEKKVPFVFLVWSTGLVDAFDFLVSQLGEVQDYIITEVSLTAIVDVWEYQESEQGVEG